MTNFYQPFNVVVFLISYHNEWNDWYLAADQLLTVNNNN